MTILSQMSDAQKAEFGAAVVAAGGDPVARAGQNVFADVKAKIAAGLPVNILFNGDSNVNSKNEAVYRFATEELLRTSALSGYGINYIKWIEGGSDWMAPEVLSTGSVPFNVWNFANPGEPVEFGMGSRWEASHILTEPDAIILIHGGNMYTGLTPPTIAGRFHSYTAKLGDAYTRMRLAAFKGQPVQNTNEKDVLYAAFDQVFAKTPAMILDVRALVEAAGKPASWYEADLTHLTTEANGLTYLPLLVAAWRAAVPSNMLPGTFWSQVAARNLIQGGDFSDWTGTFPVSGNGTFSARGNAQITKGPASSFYRQRLPYCMRVTGDGSTASPAIRWAASSALVTKLRGKTLSFAARQFVPEGIAADGSRGRLSIQTNAGSISTVVTEQGQGDPWPRAIAAHKMPDNLSFLFIHGGSDENGASDRYADFSFLSACLGDLPRVGDL